MRASARLMLLVLGMGTTAFGTIEAAQDLPYRTDTSNEHLPWYRLKPGEFPPFRSEHRVTGDLVEADFIHRTGRFRAAGTGELVDFTLLPSATVLSLDAEGDLRDVPLGTTCQFSLYQDERGGFTKVAAVYDEFSRVARQGLVYRLDASDLGAGRLAVTARSPGRGREDRGHEQFLVDEKTRVWKGNGPAKPGDLAVGDELLVNVTGGPPDRPGRCTDIWAGAEAQKRATEQQQQRHDSFLRERGLACWIDRVEGKRLTVTLFGDPSSLQRLCKQDGIDPARWAGEHRFVEAVVANEELRTYNPPVDRKRAKVLEFQAVPTESHGCSGFRWVIEPDLLLEGFRKGRIIRLFVHHSWPVNDMAFGEGLYTEAPGVRPALEEPTHYPYRTDFANEDLPWYRPKSGEFPPLRSAHRVDGELLKVDVAHRSGRFRTDRTGELVDFTMPPYGAVMALNTEGDLRDLSPGTRYHFFLHQDDRGVFTRAAVIMDEFTDLASNDLSYRVDAIELEEGRLLLAQRHARVKNDKEDLIQPPDFGRGVFAVDATTRVWKDDKRIELGTLAVGDDLLVNLSGRTATSRGVCTDLWVNAGAQKLASDRQRAKHEALLKESGPPAWIDRVEGTTLTITFFAQSRKDLLALLNKDVAGDGITITLADDELRPIGAPSGKFRLRDQSWDDQTTGTYGSSGVHWRIEAEKIDEADRPGRVIRVFRQGWPIPDRPGL